MVSQFTTPELIIMIAMIINFIVFLVGTFIVVSYIKKYREKKVTYLVQKLKECEAKDSNQEQLQHLKDANEKLTSENIELQDFKVKVEAILNRTK